MNTVPLLTTLLDAKTADETVSNHVNCSTFTNLTITMIGAGTISGGVVTVEEAEFLVGAGGYAGTWSEISLFTASGVSGGAQSVIHLNPALYPNVRVRISTAIAGGGTITAILRAN